MIVGSRPLNDDETIVLAALYAALQQMHGKRERPRLQDVQAATTDLVAGRRPLAQVKLRAILKELGRRYSHTGGSAVAAERVLDEPLVYRHKRRNSPARFMLSERGLAKARELDQARAAAHDRLLAKGQGPVNPTLTPK